MVTARSTCGRGEKIKNLATEGKRSLGSSRHRRKNIIKSDVREIGREFVNIIHLVKGMAQWKTFIDIIMNFGVL
jgi:hypothetical protein